MYQQKIGQAVNQDNVTRSRYEEQKGELSILTKTRQELVVEMPNNSASEQIVEAPSSKALKQALDNVEGAKAKKQDILKDCV